MNSCDGKILYGNLTWTVNCTVNTNALSLSRHRHVNKSSVVLLIEFIEFGK